MLDIVYQNLTNDKKFNQKFFEDIIKSGISELNLDGKDIGLSINLVGEGRIRALNKKYRHKNKVTDVLSFPILSIPPNKLLRYCATSLLPIGLGDLFICLPFAKKRAKSENISVEEKLARLTVHGFLHLAGYDHEKSVEDMKLMFNLERKILQKLEIK